MRHPAVAGFYPNDKAELENTVKSFLKSEKKMENALGLISPHAGYQFSGSVAGKTFASAKTEKRNFVLLGPNHTGYGSPASLSRNMWQTPLGSIETDFELIKKIGLPIDENAHMYEHSIEVQLPFLQILYKNFKIAPLCLQSLQFDDLKEIAEKFDANNFYIASSDFTHYGPNYGYDPISGSIEKKLAWVRYTDKKLIDMICNLQAEKFYNAVVENDYTVCGFVPITLLLLVMKNIGAKKGVLVDYKTSYEVHPSDSFVSYAGIVFC
jgi:hypothetical protein